MVKMFSKVFLMLEKIFCFHDYKPLMEDFQYIDYFGNRVTVKTHKCRKCGKVKKKKYW